MTALPRLDLPPLDERLLQMYNDSLSSRLNRKPIFPINPNLPPLPPPRYASTYNVQTGKGLNRTNRALPSTPTPPPISKSFLGLVEKIKRLPRELQLTVLTNFSYDQLRHICRTDKYFASLCQNENLWRQMYQKRFSNNLLEGETWKGKYETELTGPLIQSIGIPNFLNLFVPNFVVFMQLNPGVAKIYKVPLTEDDIEFLESARITDEETFDVYAQYLKGRVVPSVDPYKLYKFDVKDKWRQNNSIFDNFADVYDYGVDNLDESQLEILDKFLLKLKDPKTLTRFLNSPIPGLQNVTIVNPTGVNWDSRSLINIDYRDGTPALNIIETGEDFEYTINKTKITLLDILIGVMSVKSSKEDFWYERLYSMDFNPETNVITLDISPNS